MENYTVHDAFNDFLWILHQKGVSGKIPPLTDEDKENISNLFKNKPELNAADKNNT